MLIGGVVTTLDGERPSATAIAIRDGRIAAVGGDDEVGEYVGPATRVIALGGRAVTPGLVDAHGHLYDLGESLEQIALGGTTSEADAVARVATAAAALPADEWALGHGWDQNLWPGQGFPGAASLDHALGARPAALGRIDGHAMWVNSAALARAGIDDATADPAGGTIMRDARGHATGVLVDAAMALVNARVPDPTPAVRRRRIQRAAAVALAQGLTAMHEMGVDDDTAAVFRALADEGRLPIRITAYLDGSPARAAALAGRIADVDRAGDALFAIVGMKLFADGALGSRGARLLEPYADAPTSRGTWVTAPVELTAAVEAATAAGFQVAVHAIGDAGVRAALDAFAAAHALRPDARPRLEHAQVIAPTDVARLVATGAIASMQPIHAISDMGWAEARLGPARIAGAYAWRTVLDAGAPLAFGSDVPYDQGPPLVGLRAAVTRQDAAGQPAGGWLPGQRLTIAEALAAYTTGAAYAVSAERQRGRIAVGMVADLTVFDRALAVDQLARVKVDATIVGGRVVFERK